MKALACILLASSLYAAEPCGLPWKPTKPDGNYIVPSAVGEVIYRNITGRALAMDAWIPDGPGPHPAAIIVHGGDWKSGSHLAYITQLFELLARAGIAWFAMDYRLAPESPMAAQDDLAAAARFIRCHAPRLRVDPKRIGLIGEDTGATMAVLEAAENPAHYRGLVAIGGRFPERYEPLPTPGFPPTLVIHGTADRDVPLEEAMRFCDRLRSRAACLFYVVEGAIHRFENWLPAQRHYRAELVPWLRERLQVKSAPPSLRWPTQGAGLLKDVDYAPDPDLKFDAWIPRGAGPHPAVVIVHGGGWEAGDKVTYVAPLFEALAEAGFAWFSIDFRLTPAVKHPEQLDDLRRAIRFVRQNAARFRVNPQKIAILGESSGAQMVTQVASTPCDGCRPDAVVAFYGVYDLAARAAEGGPRPLHQRLFALRELDDAARAQLRDFSPITHVQKDLPPILLIQGGADRLHAQGLEYARRLKEAGARHELIVLDGAPHGLENWEGRPEWQWYKRKMVDWLKARMR